MPRSIKIVAFRIKIIYYIPGTKSSKRGAVKNSAVIFSGSCLPDKQAGGPDGTGGAKPVEKGKEIGDCRFQIDGKRLIG